MDEIARRQFLSFQKVPPEVWQVLQVRLSNWILDDNAAEPFRPVFGICVCPQSDKVFLEQPGPDDPDFVARLVSNAAGAWRRRPGTIQTSDPETAERLRDFLIDGAAVVELRELPVLDDLVEALRSAAVEEEGDLGPEALSVPGVTVEQMAAFARAAARFFAAAPWRHLGNDDLIRIESPEAEPDLRYALVMGSGRTEYGLLFFDSPALWEAFNIGNVEAVLEAGHWSVSFDAAWELVRGDLELWERHDLSRSGDLYPVAARLQREGVERPDAARLAFFEGMFEALAATTEEEMDAGRWEKTVTTHRGVLRFILALPELLEAEPLDDGIPYSELATPMEEALDLVDEAWEARGRRRRLLARRALDLWPDCADAYVLLAQEEPDPEKERDLLAQGVAAGERALGPRMFAERAGDFWLILETRPYMRARLSLAEALRDLGEAEEAVGHLQALLDLNPGDNQGVRYTLITLLLEAARHDEAAALLDRYGDEASAWWTYSRALLVFSEEEDSPAARSLLRTALETNRFVPKYLLDPDLLPPAPPPFYRPGAEDEAVLYALENDELWEETPGALDWLSRRRAAFNRPQKPKAKARSRQAKPRRPKKKKRR